MRCHEKWHEGKTCEERQQEMDPEVASQLSVCKECPNPKCRVMIMKEDGTCNFMRCTFCKHQFCWICKKPWKSDVYLLGLRVLPLHALSLNKPCDCPKWGAKTDEEQKKGFSLF